MLKKITTLVLIAYSFLISADNIPVTLLPNVFTMTQRLHLFNTTFDLETDAGIFGQVHKKSFLNADDFYLHDANKQLVAKATKFIQQDHIFQVADHNGNFLGEINENTGLLTPSMFTVTSCEGKIIAQGHFNFLGSQFILKDAEDSHTLVIMRRPLLQFTNKWWVSIEDPQSVNEIKLNPYLLMLMVVCLTEDSKDHTVSDPYLYDSFYLSDLD